MRFWIRVESLKRPPTLLTISSSFSSSIIGGVTFQAMASEDGDQGIDRLVFLLVFVQDVAFTAGIPRRRFQARDELSPEPAKIVGFIVGAAGAEPGFQAFERRGLDPDQDRVRNVLAYLEAALNVDHQ